MRVLIAEDDPAVATVMRVRLRPAGFAVDFAHTVDSAISRTSAYRYGAILVDLRLRDNDGIDLIFRIRAQSYHSNTPVIVISGDPERGRSDIRSSRLDILDWLNKPIDFGHLTEVLLAATSPKPRVRPCILHVDDDHDILGLVAHELHTMADVISVDSAENALRTLAADRIDLVVLDIALGDGSGLDLLPNLRDSSGNLIPVIVFSNDGPIAACDNQVDSTLSKMNSSLENLAEAVRDRLALLPSQLAKEVA